jgi:site-specific recombinase XerD
MKLAISEEVHYICVFAEFNVKINLSEGKEGRRLRPIETQVSNYLEWCEYVKRRTPATMVSMRKGLERFLLINPTLNDFSDLTNWQFDEWRASLAKEGKSGKTINGYADYVTGCVKWLKVHRKLAISLDLEIVERAAEDDTEITIYTPEEITRALAACQGPRDDLILSLAYQSGLRLTEMATLKAENIEGLALTVIGKKRKRRRTFIREDTKAKLDHWLMINDIHEKGYVFPSPVKWDSCLSSQSIREIIKAAFARAGIKKRVHPHALRHTWFTTLLDNGAPLMDTAIMGGHSDPRTTKRYYHVSPKRHSAIHQQFIPTVEQLTTQRKPVDNRPQEMY